MLWSLIQGRAIISGICQSQVRIPFSFKFSLKISLQMMAAISMRCPEKFRRDFPQHSFEYARGAYKALYFAETFYDSSQSFFAAESALTNSLENFVAIEN
jgi:hypothetical protein